MLNSKGILISKIKQKIVRVSAQYSKEKMVKEMLLAMSALLE